MFSFMKRMGVVALICLLALSLATAPVSAQSPFYQVRPGLTLQQYAYNVATIGRAYSAVPPYALGYNPYAGAGAYGGGWGGAGFPGVNPYLATAVNPYLAANPYATATLSTSPYGAGTGTLDATSPYGGYGGYGGYNPYGYYDPFRGYLEGGAAVINAQGKFMISTQQAYQAREQVRQAALDTQRKRFDEWLYERERTPTLEQERERSRIQEATRSRNDPPITEIWSAKALNDLLRDLQNQQAKGTLANYTGPKIAVDEDDLRRINVTTARSGGNLGLLKNEGRLSWPVALSGPEYKAERERLSSLAQDAIKQVSFNTPVDAGTLRQMSRDIDKLNQLLVQNVGDLPPSQYIEAKRFLANFTDAVKALSAPDASNYLPKRLKGKSVPELVDFMSRSGLLFAPAVAGDESAYLALHRALSAYDAAVGGNEQTTQPQQEKQTQDKPAQEKQR